MSKFDIKNGMATEKVDFSNISTKDLRDELRKRDAKTYQDELDRKERDRIEKLSSIVADLKQRGITAFIYGASFDPVKDLVVLNKEDSFGLIPLTKQLIFRYRYRGSIIDAIQQLCKSRETSIVVIYDVWESYFRAATVYRISKHG